jgi:UDP-N-acetylmuramoyl-tripeptide--D-alanyl-D-alanine ligase
MTGTPLWTGGELLSATQGRAEAALPDIIGISIDSRSVKPGELFIALQGPNFDGHDFAAKAVAAGAAAILAARVPDDLPASTPLVLVDDTQAGLERLGAAARARCGARIVAVTGSVGKTSTKEMLDAALAPSGPTHASAGSFNNQWGVPLSLARMPRETAYGVFELGMNHAGEIAELTVQVRPHAAIITTIEPAHLEFFDSVEAIADAKAEIFLGLEPGDTALVNRDNAQFDRLAAAAHSRGVHVLGFGAKPDSEIRLLDAATEAEGTTVSARIAGRELIYRLGVPGLHMVMNSLAVLGAVEALGADLGAAATTLGTLSGLAGRGQRLRIAVRGGSAVLIDESYNASPAAMRASFAVLASSKPGPGGRRIAVLGDMRELGSAGPALHAELAEPLIAAGIDLVFTVGPLMQHLWARLPAAIQGAHAETAADLAPLLSARLDAGDVLTVKGSLGTRMADIVKPLTAGLAADAKDRSC